MANERFQKAIAREQQDVPPIWMMRQAGRYHSHYQGLRKQHSFMDLCKKPELAADLDHLIEFHSRLPVQVSAVKYLLLLGEVLSKPIPY